MSDDASSLEVGREHGEQTASFLNSLKRHMDPGLDLFSEPGFAYGLANTYVGAILQCQMHNSGRPSDEMQERMASNQEESVRLARLNYEGNAQANKIAQERLDVERAKLAKELT